MKNRKEIAAKSVRANTPAKPRRVSGGKALARAGYFKLQRGLSATGKPAKSAAAPGMPAARVAARYMSAHRAKTKLAPAFAAAAGLPVWRSLGPVEIPHGQTYGAARPAVSGRCVGVSVDPLNPLRIIVCTAGGGLWGTDNGGGTWQALTDNQPLLSMGALARAPSAPNILYAGTGEGDNGLDIGIGLLRSSDGGATWAHVSAPALLGTAIYDIVVHPTDPVKLWIATSTGLFASRDGGAICTRVRAGTCWSISVNLGNPADVLAATGAGLLQSLDGGQTWSALPLPGLTDIRSLRRLEACHTSAASGAAFVTAAIHMPSASDADHGEGFIWYRTRASAPFRACNAPVGLEVQQAWYDWCSAVAPANPNVIYWGAIELYRGTLTAAGKISWRKISSRSTGDSIHPDQHHIAFDPTDANVVFACNDGGLFRSPNGGTNWKSLNPGLTVTEFEFLAHRQTAGNSLIIGGTQDNGTLESRSAAVWDQVALGDGGDCEIVMTSLGEMAYHSYYYMSLERRVIADGLRWRNIAPDPVRELGNAYADGTKYPCLFYPPMDAIGDAVAQAGHTLFVSDNCGDHWDEVRLSGIEPTDYASTLVFASEKLVIVGTVGGAVFRIQCGSAGWGSATVKTLTSPRRGYLSDVIAIDALGKRLWMTCSHTGGGHVYFSSDGGQTWENRTGNLPETAVNALAIDPGNSQRIFAGTDHGVFESADAGLNWRTFSNGLPNAIVGDLIVHTTSRLLRAGTRSRGAWELSI